MDKITFRVTEEPQGWFVTDGTPIGPLRSREAAVDLARGMVEAIVRAGQQADFMVEDGGGDQPRH